MESIAVALLLEQENNVHQNTEPRLEKRNLRDSCNPFVMSDQLFKKDFRLNNDAFKYVLDTFADIMQPKLCSQWIKFDQSEEEKTQPKQECIHIIFGSFMKQYIFLYRALLDTAHLGNTEISSVGLSTTVENLKLKAEDGREKCKLEIEFEKLQSINDETSKICSVGVSDNNASKNRSELVIPYDRNRVILSPIPQKENSTYINASFIEGYDNSENFIITQDPMENTIEDFWRMVMDQSITTVVMLSEIGDGPRRCPRYWADDEIQYDHILVKYMQSESCPYYTRREFNVTNCKINDTIKITQLQYNGWPTVEGEVPEVCRGIIELVDQALSLHSKETNVNCKSPLTVHCSLGTDRSSIFVAMCILVQQLRAEKCVDICTTARKIRSQRSRLIDTYAQYEFLYRAILNYADLHKLSSE